MPIIRSRVDGRINEHTGRRLLPRDSLPQQLQTALPACAQPCLTNYIHQQYPGCSGSSSIDCFCTNYSYDGYTLGELAFICVQEDCSGPSQTQQQNAYGVCSAQTSAVAATHSTLTLPAAATSTSSSATRSSSSLHTTSTSAAVIASQSGTATQSSSTASSLATFTVSPTSLLASSTSAPSTSSTAAATSTAGNGAVAASTPGSSNLSSLAAVDVSIGAFGGLAVIMTLVWCCIRARRQKGICKSPKSPHDSYDFVDDAPPRFSPFNYTYADPRGPLGGLSGRRAELPTDKRAKSEWYHQQFPETAQNEKTDALRLFHGPHHSPAVNRSNETLRTVSQLLPEKPGETPPRPSTKQFTPTMRSPETFFEEYRQPGLAAATMSSGHVPPMPSRTKQNSPIAPLSHDTTVPESRRPPTTQAHGPAPPVLSPDTRNQPVQRSFTTSPEDLKPPTLSVKPPRKASRSVLRVPLPIRVSSPPFETRKVDAPPKSGTSSKSGGSFLDYYASPEIDLGVGPLGSPLTPISLEPQRRGKAPPAAITVTKPTYPPRAVRRGSSKRESAGSDTSFESTDPDEPTPPDEEDKQLSPVAEHSPIARVKYPKIPRSSNQAIPRSPPMQMPSPTYSPSRGRRTQQSQDDRAGLPSRARPLQPTTPEHQISSPTSSLGGTTLAAKRRGDSAEADKRLFIDTSHLRSASRQPVEDKTAATPPRISSAQNGRHDSPLKGYGRVTSAASGRPPLSGGRRRTNTSSNVILTPEMKSPGPTATVVQYVHGPDGQTHQQVVLKSPLWEPKLTPRRHGEDLYLEVGMASPGVVSPTSATKTPVGQAPMKSPLTRVQNVPR
ncbi:hypothetical protein LTR78_007737 [Recurvomyces mirabilis]|uniref:CFEM domain-containing protein n=1 Tax=Recurvomyces mirabilis TaxID=574656 RepID=A0AAE0TVA6_9PEZI|nr:hypothetical protein LTR78_007737 [Recurvomyces mirabilis]KAK5151625.1 hypothetical protein LTS14_009112 [Recurvomyces mirabilis]